MPSISMAEHNAIVQRLARVLLLAYTLTQLLTYCDKECRLLVGGASRCNVSPAQVRVQASIIRHLRVRRLCVHLPAMRVHELRQNGSLYQAQLCGMLQCTVPSWVS